MNIVGRAIGSSIGLCIAASAALTMLWIETAAAQPHDNPVVSDFASLDRCPLDPLDLALMELVAAGAEARVRVSDRAGDGLPAIVGYSPQRGTISIAPYDDGEEQTLLEIDPPDGPAAVWSVQLSGPEGRVTAILSPELDLADLSSDGPATEQARNGSSTLFARITASADLKDSLFRSVRELSLTATSVDPECGGAAAWCAKYASRFIGPAIICAASFGADGNSCGEALDAHCAWCECKGYDCKKC